MSAPELFATMRTKISHNRLSVRDCRPLGAVGCGKKVRLALRVNSDAVQQVRLVLFSAASEQTLSMTRQGGLYAAEFTAPGQPVTMWYYFELLAQDETFCYGADERSCFGRLYTARPPAFQLTVYATDFVTPSWLRNGVMYQIFPDRFAPGDAAAVQRGLEYHRALGRRMEYHADWREPVKYLPRPGEQNYAPDDFYGGTLNAMREKLPYLQSLGVTVIYLNPLFEAASNHRYDTADYQHIDPILGTNEDFCALAQTAAQCGIRLVLDGVFSHTGADSRYFDLNERYGAGAYHHDDSPYRTWYERHQDGTYRCWWGFPSLPEVDEHQPDWQSFIISGERSVLRRWLSFGASGWRLDVADELPDDVLMLMRTSVKQTNPDAALIGEVWEDATNKRSYDMARSYALGHALDSVMNYPLRSALIDFLLGHSDAFTLTAFLARQRLNYPPPLYYALMNLLSSHDVARIRTVLATRLEPRDLTHRQQAGFFVSDAQDAHGARLQLLAATLQFSLPGLPCIYYGDEQGMQGMLDPFNRAPFCRGAYPLETQYARLAALRHQHDALRGGAVAFIPAGTDVVGVLRFIDHGIDMCGDPATDGCLVTVINRAETPRRVVLDLYRSDSGLSQESYDDLLRHNYRLATCLLDGTTATVESGLLTLTLPPLSTHIFTLI